MKTTKTYGPVLIKSFYDMEELMAAYRAICERPVHEDSEITVVMSDWYGDPYRRDIKMSMRFMGAPVLLEEGDGWVAREVLPKPEPEEGNRVFATFETCPGDFGAPGDDEPW